MPVTLKQKVKFRLPPSKIYPLYADAKLHSDLTGGKAVVGTEPGAKFSVFGGTLKGITLFAKKNRLFVQTWRTSDWPKEADDSILVLMFREVEGGTEVEMVHANVADFDAEGVKSGWNDYYWTPWKEYIRGHR